ncbi:unnamed protein product, partial [Prorocentrum cordatum]
DRQLGALHLEAAGAARLPAPKRASQKPGDRADAFPGVGRPQDAAAGGTGLGPSAGWGAANAQLGAAGAEQAPQPAAAPAARPNAADARGWTRTPKGADAADARGWAQAAPFQTHGKGFDPTVKGAGKGKGAALPAASVAAAAGAAEPLDAASPLHRNTKGNAYVPPHLRNRPAAQGAQDAPKKEEPKKEEEAKPLEAAEFPSLVSAVAPKKAAKAKAGPVVAKEADPELAPPAQEKREERKEPILKGTAWGKDAAKEREEAAKRKKEEDARAAQEAAEAAARRAAQEEEEEAAELPGPAAQPAAAKSAEPTESLEEGPKAHGRCGRAGGQSPASGAAGAQPVLEESVERPRLEHQDSVVSQDTDGSGAPTTNAAALRLLPARGGGPCHAVRVWFPPEDPEAPLEPTAAAGLLACARGHRGGSAAAAPDPRARAAAASKVSHRLQRRPIVCGRGQNAPDMNGFSIFDGVGEAERAEILGLALQDAGGQRAIGSMVGMAVADGVGHMFEFLPVGESGHVFDMERLVCTGPYNRFRLKPGQWTDDTSMGLCLADSLLVCGEYNGSDVRKRFWNWWFRGYNNAFRLEEGRCDSVGLGGNIKSSLSRMSPEPPPRFDEFGGKQDQDAGNGSLMRLSPVPIFFHHDPALAARVSSESSLTTHPGPIAADACSFLGFAIARAIRRGRRTTARVRPSSWTSVARPTRPCPVRRAR